MLNMNGFPITSITIFFKDLPDPRMDRTKLHSLHDILAISFMAVICGADGYEDIADFGEARETWLRTVLPLPHGIPSADTFGRVFGALDPAAFAQCFVNWVKHVSGDLAGDVVAVDGKTLRRSFDQAAKKGPLHLVSALAADSGLSLGQVAVNDKSNEITAIPRLLKMLDIKGATVTVDAAGCQKKISQQIVEKEGDYVLAVKGNQKSLLGEVKRLYKEVTTATQKGVCDVYEAVEKDHGRIETRKVWYTNKIDWMRESQRWPGLGGVGVIQSQRQVGDKITEETRYFITSHGNITAKRMAYLIRQHWGIENSLHWVLDVIYGEDQCRVRKGNGDQNLALLRKISLNMFKREKTLKASLRRKRLRAGWDNNYLLKILAIKPI